MDSASGIASILAPIATIASAGAGFLNKPKTPNIKIPNAAAPTVMPTQDDASAQQAAFKTIALRSAQHGRNSTNLYDKQGKLGG